MVIAFSSSPILKRLYLPLLKSPQVAGLFKSGDTLGLLSLWACHHSRKLMLPRENRAIRSSKLADQVERSTRITWKEHKDSHRLEFKYLQSPPQDFCSFIESYPKAEVIAFFRDVARVIEGRHQLEDFHLKVKDDKDNFRVSVFYGDEKIGPEPLAPGQCISCFADIPLFPEMKPVVEARECILDEFRDQPYVLCRLDAKARAGFVITPLRHVERMSDLNDEELFALWSVAVRALRQAELPFISMILNHGNYRHVHHLHLKVWVDRRLYEHYLKRWSDDRKDVWKRLQEYSASRPKKEVECIHFKKNKWCRHGDFCSYLHVHEV